MTLRAGILAVLLVLVAAAPARAAFDVTEFSVTPSTTAAGAHADVTIAAGFTPYSLGAPPQRPRNVTFHLPPGLAGDPFATARCSEASFRADGCPANTKVGTVAAHATALLVPPIGVGQDVTGDVYNLVPAGKEPARLGAVLRPAGGLLGKLFVPTVITARATDGGLDSIVTDLPRALNGIQLYTDRMAFTLQGRPAGGKGPFMRNPTSCAPATSSVVAVPYDTPATPVTKTSTFTPTGCAALPFSPHIAATVGANGQTARGASPPIRTVITQAAEQAGQQAVTVTLPGIVAPDLPKLARACTAPDVAARRCPATARVGTVEAATPLLAAPLTGDVFLAARPPGQLPGLTIQLADPIPLRLEGTAALSPKGLRTTFTGLPDVPLSRFQLSLFGGEEGVFRLLDDICSVAQPPTVEAAYAAQSGATSGETVPVAVAGCTPAPKVHARITGLRGGRPNLRLDVRAADGAPDLRQVRVILPDALPTKPKRARRGAKATTGAGALPRAALRLSDGELRVALPEGTRVLHATLAKGAVVAPRKLRRAKQPKLQKLTVLVRDAHGPRPTRTLNVRPRRR